MLIEFRVKNHRSIREEQVLTMQAGALGAPDDERPRKVQGYSESLLPAAVLYGANASGKSNVLSALVYMRDAVQESHRSWAPKQGVPRDAFAWGPCKFEPSVFEVTMLQQGVKYDYGFAISDRSVLEEWLFAWPNGHRQTWFERERQSFQFGGHLKGENKVIEGLTRENSLFLSAAAQNNHAQLTPVFEWFSDLLSINVASHHSLANLVKFNYDEDAETLVAMLLDDQFEKANRNDRKSVSPSLRSRFTKDFRNLMRVADTGIVDLRVIPSSTGSRSGKSDPLFQLKHQSESNDAWISLAEESRGTQRLFRLAMPLVESVLTGRILLVDELEASLHPSLAQRIVQQFNDPATNPVNAQLIFTTHDTNLLGTTVGKPVLRRDQVWLTEKNKEGATTIYPLTDYKPRKAENLERGYLQGRYGAIPFLGEFSIAAE